MSKEQKGYISYLIRLWQVESKGELVWRASLESWQTGKRQGFANLEALLAFLRKATETPTSPGTDWCGRNTTHLDAPPSADQNPPNDPGDQDCVPV